MSFTPRPPPCRVTFVVQQRYAICIRLDNQG
jgi:hypothetical protein